MSNVTIVGSHGETVSLNISSAQEAAQAQSLAVTITQAVAAGRLTPVDYTGTSLPVPPSGSFEEVVIKANGPVSLPAAAVAVVDAAAASVVFGGGAANESVLAGSGNFVFNTDGGSGTIIAGSGNDKIIQSGHGPWDIFTGAGNDLIDVSGGKNTISAGSGSNEILLAGGNNLVNSTGRDVIQALTGADTIAATGDSPVRIMGVDAKLTFYGADGPATVIGGAGSTTIFGGGGGVYHGGSAGNNEIIGGSGTTTIFGGGNGDKLYSTGPYGTQIFAAGGNETLDGSLSTGNDSLAAGSGRDLLIAGFGNDTLTGGTGASTMQGGSGLDVFKFLQGDAGATLVTDFSGLQGDKIDLSSFGAGAVQAALASARVTGLGTVITLSDHTEITFAHVTDLTKGDFT